MTGLFYSATHFRFNGVDQIIAKYFYAHRSLKAAKALIDNSGGNGWELGEEVV